MPDLLLWSTEGQRAKLSEIKGPRDRLSDQQRAWAAALTAAGLQVLPRTTVLGKLDTTRHDYVILQPHRK